MLTSTREVSEVYCIKDAKVPLMRFKLDGISIDLPYARLVINFVPENVDILDPFFVKNVDETSWRSLSGVHANRCILGCVPRLEMFQALLRCIKFWAKKRGVYGNLFGFLGGVHLAILAAFVCQRYPNASLSSLLTSFFRTFAYWDWPRTPVCLQDGLPRPNFTASPRTTMAIRLPCKPNEFCHSNISESTYYKIKKELNRGYNLCMEECLNPDSDWARLFEAYPYTKKYNRFIKICLSASDPHKLGNWTGWIKSRFPSLLLQLEAIHWLCDPNPTEYVDSNVFNPNVVFYWGLKRDEYLDIQAVREQFLMTLPKNNNSSCRGKITMAVVKVDQLPKFADIDTETNASTNI